MEKVLYETAQGLANILGYGTVQAIRDGNMSENERGWSGDKVLRKKVRCGGGSVPMIFKYAGRKERCAMKRLTEQGQRTPASYTLDTASDSPAWIAMEDLGRQQPADPNDGMWMQKVAECLASIHGENMGKGSEMPWLPAADEAYWTSITSQISVAHFRRKMEENPGFEREFGKYLPRLEHAGRQFARDMTALCREGGCMTLTHGDLQMQDGAHIYNRGGVPYVIDFGFCRYAPFYIDLAGWFTADHLRIYYDALSDRGFSLRYSDFEERARAAFRYNGFIYLYPSIVDWGNGPTRQTGRRLLQAMKIILDGDFPDTFS